jgi:hypothetical protein
VQGADIYVFEGEASMTREEALQTIMLLSALESWSFSTKNPLPDFVDDKLRQAIELLARIILEEKQA